MATTLEKECKTLHEKLERSTATETATEVKVKHHTVEVAKEKELSTAQATELMAKEMELKVAGLREELVDAASRYTWKTKERMMKPFMEGQMSSWTPEADFRQFL